MLVLICPFEFSHCGGCEVISHCGFDLHFPDDSMEKKCKKAKWLSEEALLIAVKQEKRKANKKRKDIPI